MAVLPGTKLVPLIDTMRDSLFYIVRTVNIVNIHFFETAN